MECIDSSAIFTTKDGLRHEGVVDFLDREEGVLILHNGPGQGNNSLETTPRRFLLSDIERWERKPALSTTPSASFFIWQPGDKYDSSCGIGQQQQAKTILYSTIWDLDYNSILNILTRFRSLWLEEATSHGNEYNEHALPSLVLSQGQGLEEAAVEDVACFSTSLSKEQAQEDVQDSSSRREASEANINALLPPASDEQEQGEQQDGEEEITKSMQGSLPAITQQQEPSEDNSKGSSPPASDEQAQEDPYPDSDEQAQEDQQDREKEATEKMQSSSPQITLQIQASEENLNGLAPPASDKTAQEDQQDGDEEITKDIQSSLPAIRLRRVPSEEKQAQEGHEDGGDSPRNLIISIPPSQRIGFRCLQQSEYDELDGKEDLLEEETAEDVQGSSLLMPLQRDPSDENLNASSPTASDEPALEVVVAASSPALSKEQNVSEDKATEDVQGSSTQMTPRKGQSKENPNGLSPVASDEPALGVVAASSPSLSKEQGHPEEGETEDVQGLSPPMMPLRRELLEENSNGSASIASDEPAVGIAEASSPSLSKEDYDSEEEDAANDMQGSSAPDLSDSDDTFPALATSASQPWSAILWPLRQDKKKLQNCGFILQEGVLISDLRQCRQHSETEK